MKTLWKGLFGVGAAAVSLFCADLAIAQKLDPNNADDALKISRKIYCSVVDGEPATFWWFGKAYSRRQGERDRHLFNVEGMNIRACSKTDDGGFKLVSRELLIYKDPQTNEILNTWENPWTGQSVDVLHVANDPVNGVFSKTGRDGKPYKWSGVISGEVWWQTATVPLFYPNPLASAYQSEIGGTYHATEMFNFFGPTASLLDPSTEKADGVEVGWSRMSDWLPWMKMAGREGIIYMHTAGKKLKSYSELPKAFRDEIAAYYPKYDTPPPLDDDRANMTSWKYYDGVAKGEIEVPKRK